MYGVSPEFSMRIAKVESNFNPNAYSYTKDGGLFQLNTKYHKFHNPDWIFDKEINTHRAMNLLSKFKKICKFNKENYAALCYNMGKSRVLSLKNPEKQTYLKKLTLVWR